MTALEQELVAKHGEPQRPRIKQGLAQVAALWRSEDGDLGEFARAQFQADPAALQATFGRLEAALEQLDGHYNEITRELRRPSDVDIGPQWPVDALLSSMDAAAHALEDLFASKVAFVALLNFPQTSLEQRLGEGSRWTREQWAAARLTGRFVRRVPGPVQQRIAAAASAGERYINGYNLWMHHLLDPQGVRLFRKGLRLISHWNLRDEIRGDYAEREGLFKQRLIARVMQHIVQQTIPAAVIDNPRLDWNPFTGAVTPSPPEEIEADAPPPRATAAATTAATAPSAAPNTATNQAAVAPREPDTRYALLLDNFRAQRQADPYSPATPTLIARSFELGREIPEKRVVQLLTELCASPLAKQVGERIEQRLGRKLEPHDLWYNGFLPRGRFSEAELDAMTARRYPSSQAFEADLPRILGQLGFAREKAKFIAEHIRVDASRGAGHALQAMRRGDFPHLRTRVEKTGMNYKGYNIAVHELGHNVEQVFSLYSVDHTLLAGVPNNAFTEALAFVFQARDLELLGLRRPDAASERERVLNDFWQTWEIAGVALVDVATWHWLYDHPEATPAELREAVVRIARETWDRYYAPLLGGRGTPLLGIYSHMISYPLYLADYPLGHLIAFQIEDHLKTRPRGQLGAEFERMATFGAVTPDVWMTHATGAPVSAEPLLRAT
ncbi:MAG TPA: hypothetical protein PLW65_27410, partial [Pseudomonadota bacterium]|nr:hypothetical protein [Pseudomonadota bacterium]